MKTITTKDGHVKENDKLVSVHFDSILELMDHKATGTNQAVFESFFGEGNENRGNQGREWLGDTNSSYKSVIDHALAGDSDMCDVLTRKISKFKTKIGAHRADYQSNLTKRKRKRKNRDFGDELDIHKVLQGKLDTAWSKMEKVEMDKLSPLVTIAIDIVGNGGEACESSYWRAAIALHVAQELQSAGKAVKIVLVECGSNWCTSRSSGAWSKTLTTSIVIKDFNQSVSIERIAAMTHFGFYRTFNFGAMSVQDHPLSVGFGASVDLKESIMPIHLQEEIADGKVKFLHVGRVRRESQVESELAKVYKQLGSYKN